MDKTKKREITFARHLIAYINKWHGNITTSHLGEIFGIDPSGLSRAIAKIEKENSQFFLEKVKMVIDCCEDLKLKCQNVRPDPRPLNFNVKMSGLTPDPLIWKEKKLQVN